MGLKATVGFPCKPHTCARKIFPAPGTPVMMTVQMEAVYYEHRNGCLVSSAGC